MAVSTYSDSEGDGDAQTFYVPDVYAHASGDYYSDTAEQHPVAKPCGCVPDPYCYCHCNCHADADA